MKGQKVRKKIDATGDVEVNFFFMLEGNAQKENFSRLI